MSPYIGFKVDMDEKSDRFSMLILSGGGYRGLFTAKVLADIERETDKPINEHFDLIAGPAHQLFAEKLWQDTGKLVGYIGEWHTHPEPHPAPSGIDSKDWLRISKTIQHPMLFMIVSCHDVDSSTFFCVLNKKIQPCKKI
jgi:integrative and conjugative element protein (TIGR02256 family)